MNGDNTAGHVVVTTLDKSGVLHHFKQGVLIRMLADGLRQITITVSILSNETTDRRQDLKRVLIVDFAKQG